MRVIKVFLVLCILFFINLKGEGKKSRVIEPIKDLKLELPATGPLLSFIVKPEGTIFISDYRNGQILIVSSNGKYIKTFGKKGYGPDEFNFPRVTDYRNGELLINDSATHRVHIYNVDKQNNFKHKFSMISKYNLRYELLFCGDKFLNCSMGILLRIAQQNEACTLYLIDKEDHVTNLVKEDLFFKWPGKGTSYMGVSPMNLPEVFFFSSSSLAHCATHNGIHYVCQSAKPLIYYTKEGQKIFKNTITSKDYKPFVVDRHLRIAATRKKDNRSKYKSLYDKAITRYSKITKIFACDDFYGVTFDNFNGECWETFVEIFDHNNKSIRRLKLKNAKRYFKYSSVYFQKDTKILYTLKHYLDNDEDVYHVMGYKL